MGSSVAPVPVGADANGAPTGATRILSPDEFATAKTLSAPQLARAQFPTIPPTFAPKDATGRLDPMRDVQKGQTTGTRLTGLPRVLTEDVAEPMMDNPMGTAGQALGLGAMGPVIGGIVGGGKMAYDFTKYAIQRHQESEMTPEALAAHEADPNHHHISGEKTAVEAATIPAALLMHAGFKRLQAGGSFVDPTVTAAVKQHATDVADSWNTMFAPANRGPEAAQAATILRSTTGHSAASYEQAAFKLDEFRRAIDPLSDEDKLAFIDHIEGGKSQPNPDLQPAADAMRKILDDGRTEVQNLGTGKLENFIKDYFPHIWEDPDRASTAFEAASEKSPEQAPVRAPDPAKPEPLIDILRRDYGDDAHLDHSYTQFLPEDVRVKQAKYVLGYTPQVADEVAADFAKLPQRKAFVDKLRSDWGDQIPVYRAGEVVPGRLQSFTTDPATARAFSITKKVPVQRYTVSPEDVAFPGFDKHSELVIDGGRPAPVDNAAPAASADALQRAKIAAGGKRPMEGAKSFLKQRTIPTTKEGMEMGLTPVTTNPIDLTLLKLREMQRYVMAHQSLNEMKEAGLAKFVAAGDQAPDGYAKINDKIATVFGPRQGAVDLPEGASVPASEPIPHINGQPIQNADLPEHVIAAANKTKDGRIFVGNMHFEATDASDGLIASQGGPKSVGFVTNKGRFVSRKGAEKFAAPDVIDRLKKSGDTSLDANDFNRFGGGVTPGEMTMQSPTAETKPLDPNDVGVHGMRIMGEHWAPEPVAKVVNNYLSPGLRGNMLYDIYRGLGNGLNQAQLGLSAFHLGMTSLDASVSRTALGLEYLADRNPAEGAKAILSSPVAAFPGIAQGTIGDLLNARFGTQFKWGLGAKIRDAYLNPESASPQMQALANAVKEAGGRIKQDSFYQTSAPAKITAAWKNGEYAKATALSLPALIEMTAKPLMEHVVPLQKLQVFGEMAQKTLADLPEDASLFERRQALADAWDHVDNRMGQLVYDNLFWNKTFKDLAMGGVRSVGWNLGTIRELGGGTVDLAKTMAGKQEMTRAAYYAIGLPTTLAMYGAAYQYLRTGQGPSEMKDYFFPRTGEVDADGNPERVQLPSYMKDFFAYEGHPVETVKHKMAPLLSGIYEMLNNQDYYGDEIRNPNDDAVKQLGQEAEFIAKQVVPFSVQGIVEDKKRGDQSSATKFGNWFGITPAPRDKVRSPAENRMNDFLSESHETGGTPEAADARKTRADLLGALRDRQAGKGDVKDLQDKVTAALEAHQIVPADIGRLLKKAGSSPDQERFKLLNLPQAVEVFKASTPTEQAKFGELLLKKIERARK